MKFIPQGTLTVQAANGDLYTFPQGLTIRFTISRKALASTQTAQFRVYGLSSEERDQIYKDRFDLSVQRSATFMAGYPDFTSQIFNGFILQAYSEKEGNVDSVTVIDCFDGGYQMTNGFVSETIPAGQRAEAVIAALGSTLPGASTDPIVGNFPDSNLRPEILVGNAWDVIQYKSGGNATIDNGQVKALNPNEALATPQIPLVSSATGLIGVPKRSGALVEFDMIFEPRLSLFGLINLQSTFNPQFNGPHKVIGFEHRGAISKSEAVQNITTGSFIWFPEPVASDTLKGILISS